jgi:hypothetical protein
MLKLNMGCVRVVSLCLRADNWRGRKLGHARRSCGSVVVQYYLLHQMLFKS